MAVPFIAALAVLKLTSLASYGGYQLGKNDGDIDKAIQAVKEDLANLGVGAKSIAIDLPKSLYDLATSDDFATIARSTKHIKGLTDRLPEDIRTEVNETVEPIIAMAVRRGATSFIFAPKLKNETPSQTLSRKYLGLYLLGRSGAQLSFEHMVEVKNILVQLHMELGQTKVAKTLKKFSISNATSELTFASELSETGELTSLRTQGNDMMVHIFIIYALGAQLEKLDFSGIDKVVLERFGSTSPDSKAA